MVVFFVKRIFQAITVMIVISLIAFTIQSQLGNPVQEIMGISASAEEKEKLLQELGLKDPFLIQYQKFLFKAVQGDFGQSYFYKKPALEVILKKAPATLELVLVSVFIILILSIPLGIYTAIHPNSWISRLIMTLSIIGVSVPVFLTAIILIYVFSVELQWFPSFGRGETTNVFGWESNFFSLDGWNHLILPSLTLSSIMLPLFIRLVRSEMMETLETVYIQFARSKGLSENRIRYVHAFRNTLLPLVTVGGVQIGIMIAYTILTETVFQWQGMGFIFLEAVERSDIPLLTVYLMVVGVIFVTANTIVDLLYTLVNPMIRIKSGL